jgi:hypothetical protein
MRSNQFFTPPLNEDNHAMEVDKDDPTGKSPTSNLPVSSPMDESPLQNSPLPLAAVAATTEPGLANSEAVAAIATQIVEYHPNNEPPMATAVVAKNLPAMTTAVAAKKPAAMATAVVIKNPPATTKNSETAALASWKIPTEYSELAHTVPYGAKNDPKTPTPPAMKNSEAVAKKPPAMATAAVVAKKPAAMATAVVVNNPPATTMNSETAALASLKISTENSELAHIVPYGAENDPKTPAPAMTNSESAPAETSQLQIETPHRRKLEDLCQRS